MDLSNFTIRHDPATCPTCAAIRDAQRAKAEAEAIKRGDRCMWGVPGCNCWGAAEAEYEASIAVAETFSWAAPVAPFSLADIGLTDDEFDTPVAEGENDSELARIIGDVRAGLILLPEEGETLVQALVDEEQDHAETLADLGDAEDRIAELEGELAFKNFLLGEAGNALALAANAVVSADGLIDAQRLYIRILERRVAELTVKPTITITSLYI